MVVVEAGLRMGKLFDAIFDINWGDREDEDPGWSTVWREPHWGAWIAWRVTEEKGCRHVRVGMPADFSQSPMDWVAGADLIIGEHNYNASGLDDRFYMYTAERDGGCTSHH